MVLDASVVVELLLSNRPFADELEAAGALVAPDLLLVEVAAGLRRAARRGLIEDGAVPLLYQYAAEVPVALAPVGPLVERALELRHNVTVADGCYVALAEDLDCGVLTADTRLAGAPGLDVPFTVV